MNKYLYFAASATDQYIVPLSRLLGADDTGSSKVVLHFEDFNGSTAKDGDITKVVLSVKSGKEKEALNDLFEGVANKEDRSHMNVTFTLTDESKKEEFDSMWKKAGISGINGHRSVGGYRASIYNAMPIESIQTLVDVMKAL